MFIQFSCCASQLGSAEACRVIAPIQAVLSRDGTPPFKKWHYSRYIVILILRKTVFENGPKCLLFICFFQATLSKGQQRFAPYWRRAKVALQHSKNGAFSRSELFMETQHNTTRFFAEARIYEKRANSQLIFCSNHPIWRQNNNTT